MSKLPILTEDFNLVKITMLTILPYPWPVDKTLPDDIINLHALRVCSVTDWVNYCVRDRIYTDEEKRYFTLAGAINGRLIPNDVILVDDTTKKMLMKYLELTAIKEYVSMSELNKIISDDNIDISKHLLKYKNIINKYLTKGQYYSRFGITLNLVEDYVNTDHYKTKMVKECVTTWALKNNCKIEKEYIVYNPIVKKLLQNI